MASVGAKVVLAARRAERLNALAERIEASGGKALPIVTDVTDETQVNDLVRDAIAQLGRVDIVVNNAGIALLGTLDIVVKINYAFAEILVETRNFASLHSFSPDVYCFCRNCHK